MNLLLFGAGAVVGILAQGLFFNRQHETEAYNEGYREGYREGYGDAKREAKKTFDYLESINRSLAFTKSGNIPTFVHDDDDIGEVNDGDRQSVQRVRRPQGKLPR